MGRMRKLSEEERRAARRALVEAASSGELALSGAVVRRMRLATGLSRVEFARRIAGISPSALAQIESGAGNPTSETLGKIGAAFGFEVGFVPKRE